MDEEKSDEAPPPRKPPWGLLRKGWFLATVEPLRALPQPLKRVAHAGLSVLGGVEWR